MDLLKFLIGDQSVDSDDKKRKVLLGACLIVLYFFIDLFFYLINFFNPEGILWILISGVGISIFSLALLRYRYTNAAIFVYLLRANSIIYYFASQESLDTGSFIYFISYGITPLAFYGYLERWKGIAYALVSYFLFLVAKLEPSNFRPDHAHFYFIANFTFVLFTLSFIVLFFDWMNRKAFQKIENQNKELVKINEELDRFVYSASHDLRSPLASILGLTNLYESAATEKEKGDLLKLISKSAHKMDEFIANILDYSRNSRKEIFKSSVKLGIMLRECQQSLMYNQDFSSIHFNFEIEEDFVIISDADRLKIILTNIFSNAIKFRNQTIAQPFVKVWAQKTDKEQLIFIRDNGIGIDKKHLSRIFDMFYRGHSFSIGSGIGLYIVHESVKKMNGKISLESETGKGSTFVISLPQ